MAMLRVSIFPKGCRVSWENWSGGAKIPRKNGTGCNIFSDSIFPVTPDLFHPRF